MQNNIAYTIQPWFTQRNLFGFSADKYSKGPFACEMGTIRKVINGRMTAIATKLSRVISLDNDEACGKIAAARHVKQLQFLGLSLIDAVNVVVKLHYTTLCYMLVNLYARYCNVLII